MPGNQVLAQAPFGFSDHLIEGGMVHYTMRDSDQPSWFQCPMATHTRVLLDDDRRLGPFRFMVLFKADPGIMISRVDIWHGTRSQQFDVAFAGDQSQGLSPDNILEHLGNVPTDHGVDFALNFSLQVQPGHGGDLTFVSYGVDLY
jgi:hypothetical protein